MPGFTQAPDFIIPSWNYPEIIIEAKITEDDGTARDKVTRIINLVNLARKGSSMRYQVVAAIAGRGLAVRRQDMRQLLLATEGKVFTLATISQLVENTDIIKLATRRPDTLASQAQTPTIAVAEAYTAVEVHERKDNILNSEK